MPIAKENRDHSKPSCRKGSRITPDACVSNYAKCDHGKTLYAQCVDCLEAFVESLVAAAYIEGDLKST